MSAKPAASQPAATKPASGIDETTLEIGGGALALLALGAGAYALSRRRRREEVWEDEQPVATEPGTAAMEPAHEPIVHEHQPAVVAPAASAFAWGDKQPCVDPSDDGSDRCPGETWVERAYRGPSPANPSASLKHRLSRAAFFDKREREVAAGTSAPVETTAGLPETMVGEQENEPA